MSPGRGSGSTERCNEVIPLVNPDKMMIVVSTGSPEAHHNTHSSTTTSQHNITTQHHNTHTALQVSMVCGATRGGDGHARRTRAEVAARATRGGCCATRRGVALGRDAVR